MPSRILVTGGAGFIGSNFVHLLLHCAEGKGAYRCCPDQQMYSSGAREPLRILNLDKYTYAARAENLEGLRDAPSFEEVRADVCDATSVEAAFAKFEPEVVVHFAAESHVDRSIAGGLVFAQSNVVGTQVLLDACRRFDVPNFLHVSTDEVYGSIRDGSFHEQSHLHPSSPYAASKAASDLLVLAHHTTYGLPTAIIRCTNNYGPRQHEEKLLPKTISRALARQPTPIYGNGSNVRDWLYVKDCCVAARTVLAQPARGQVYNVAGRNERTNMEAVRMVLNAAGAPASLIEFVPDRPGHDYRYSLDDSKLRSLGWAPVVSFEQGIAWTVEWVRARHRQVSTTAH